jgi:hypothetical protein
VIRSTHRQPLPATDAEWISRARQELASVPAGKPVARFLVADHTRIQVVRDLPEGNGVYTAGGIIKLDRGEFESDPRRAASLLAHEATHRMDDVQGRFLVQRHILGFLPFGGSVTHHIDSEVRAYHREATVGAQLGLIPTTAPAGVTDSGQVASVSEIRRQIADIPEYDPERLRDRVTRVTASPIFGGALGAVAGSVLGTAAAVVTGHARLIVAGLAVGAAAGATVLGDTISTMASTAVS